MTAAQPSPLPDPHAPGSEPSDTAAPSDPADSADPDSPSAGDGAGAGADERVSDGVEHLQSAAREMIAAARTFLDVVEDVVGDHAAVASLADALGSVGQAVSRAATRSSRPDGDPSPEGGSEDPGASGVQHIDVS